ncbi:MAG TPA: hypothetical protein VG963_10105 [Polyangiaceae bacterium]|nr:hypothetical protein [Polyangiaceae bacterium]
MLHNASGAALTGGHLPAAHRYRGQRAYVAGLLQVLGRLVAAVSAADPVIRKELTPFPPGYTVGFSVLGERVGLRLAYRQGRLVLSRAKRKPDIEVVFKHISHAFAVFTFQEITPVAFAHDRMLTHGDVALTMRFVRCLERAQALLMPRALAAYALKSSPRIGAAEKLRVAARSTANLVRDLWTGAKDD